MTDEEFRAWLSDEVAGQRMSERQMHDLLAQKELFDRDFAGGGAGLRREFSLAIVGYVAGQRRIAREIHALLDGAKMQFPGRMVYFEPIGFDLF